MQNSTPRPTRYNGSCPNCNHGTMMPLARFLESDVNASPTVDSFQSTNRSLGLMIPGTIVFLMLSSWLSNLFLGEAKLVKARAKVKKARENILPRSPNAAICPNCYEVLERE